MDLFGFIWNKYRETIKCITIIFSIPYQSVCKIAMVTDDIYPLMIFIRLHRNTTNRIMIIIVKYNNIETSYLMIFIVIY